MNEKYIHDLAVAYARVKLEEYQAEQRAHANLPGNVESDDDEIRYYAKMYKSIIDRFEIEFDAIG